jgi:hypothetical protein
MSFKRISPWLALVGCLFVLDVSLRVWQKCSIATSRFRMVNIQTNDSNGIVIVDKKTGQQLWGEWDFGNHGKPDTLSFFFEGRNLMNVYPERGPGADFDVTFYRPDGSVKAIWLNLGVGGFVERVVYGDGRPRKEVWFEEAWHAVQYRTNNGSTQGGILIKGQWQHLVWTNGTWTPKYD